MLDLGSGSLSVVPAGSRTLHLRAAPRRFRGRYAASGAPSATDSVRFAVGLARRARLYDTGLASVEWVNRCGTPCTVRPVRQEVLHQLAVPLTLAVHL